jgi:hypothetical protein
MVKNEPFLTRRENPEQALNHVVSTARLSFFVPDTTSQAAP